MANDEKWDGEEYVESDNLEGYEYDKNNVGYGNPPPSPGVGGPSKGSKNNESHGLYTQYENMSDELKEQIQGRQAEIIEDLGGEESIDSSERETARTVASIEVRLAKAEDVLLEEWDHYFIETEKTHKTYDTLINRRQNLLKDLGLLGESPEAKQAEASEGFFEALEGEDD